MTNWGIFGTGNADLLQQQQHLHHTAFAQPAADYPIPDAKRMFTPDKATIRDSGYGSVTQITSGWKACSFCIQFI